MDILFFSINLIGCLIYFLYSFKSHRKNYISTDNFNENDIYIKNIDRRLAKLEERIDSQKS
jgi:hypothetical protein